MLLDTNIISETWRAVADNKVLAWFDAQDDAMLFVCTPVLSELLYGIERLGESSRRRHLVRSFNLMRDTYADRILDFNAKAAETYARIRVLRERAGRPIGPLDGMIASIALANDMPLVTRNTNDFTGIGLDLIDPFLKPR